MLMIRSTTYCMNTVSTVGAEVKLRSHGILGFPLLFLRFKLMAAKLVHDFWWRKSNGKESSRISNVWDCDEPALG